MESMNEMTVISTTDRLQAITSAEIDQQITTAHRFPRNLRVSLNRMQQLALFDEETAEECFYHLERKGRDGSVTIIEGPSIRLAEIAASSWGNIRIATRVVGNDGRMVTVEAVALDLETNVASSQQQVRSIVTRNGQTYSADMQVMTINAASSVARRNAIYNVVPKAYINKIVEQCKEMVKGAAKNDLRDRVQRVVKAFSKYGVTTEMILEKCGVNAMEEITPDMVVALTGVGNALRDGTTSVQEEFPMLGKSEMGEGGVAGAAAKAREVIERARANNSKAKASDAQQPDAEQPSIGEQKGATPDNAQSNLFENR